MCSETDLGTDELHLDMCCTANTQRLRLPFADLATELPTIRCIRPIGHAGLHRVVYKDTVYEFPDSYCWFPHYAIGG